MEPKVSLGGMAAWPLLWVLRHITEVDLSEDGGRQGQAWVALFFHGGWNGVLLSESLRLLLVMLRHLLVHQARPRLELFLWSMDASSCGVNRC